MKRVAKKNDLLRYFELSIIALVVVLLQLDIDPTIKTILSLFLTFYSLFGGFRKAMFIFLLIVPVASEISLFGGVSLTILIVSVNALKYCLLKKKLYGENGYRKKWYVWVLALLLYSAVVFGLFGTDEQLLYTIKLFAYLVFIDGYLVECTEKYAMEGKWFFSSILRMLGVGIMIAFMCLILSGGQLSSAARFSFGDLATTNNTGIQSSFVVVGLLLSRYLKSSFKIDWAIIITCSAIAIATQSRTAILMLGVAIIIYIVSAMIEGHWTRSLLLVLSLVAGLFVLLRIPTVRSYYESINDRFQVSDLSNGRYEIWGKTIGQMKSNRVFTMFGAGDYYNLDFTFGKKNETIVAHNFIIETWVVYGVVGMTLVIALLYYYIKEVVFISLSTEDSGQRRFYVFAPIIVLVLGLLFSHHFIGRANTVLFVCSFMPISCTWLKKKRLSEGASCDEK